MADIFQKSVGKCKQFFKRRYTLELPEDWLNQCVEFALETIEEQGDGNVEEIVFQQLLDFDMSEIGACSLPKIVQANDCGTIEGIYFAQICFWIDACESYYNKIQEILGKINENALVDADNVPGATQWDRRFDKKNRLMTLFITDGSMSIKAIEYEHIPALKKEILPGQKILLKGRIKYQNQVLFLKPENVDILGGHVEDISTPDHFVELLENELEAKVSEGTPSDREVFKKFESVPFKSGGSIKEEKSTQQRTKTYQVNHNFNYQSSMNHDDDDEDELLQACNFDQITTKNTNAVKTEPVMKRAPSTDVITVMQKETTKVSSFGKKIKQQTIADSDDEDALLMQGDLIEKVLIKSSVVSSSRNFQNDTKPAINKNNHDSKTVLSNKMNIKNYEEMDYEDMDYMDTKPAFKQEMKPPVVKQETIVKKEMHVLKQEPQKKIELLTKLIEIKFLESCCLLNQADESSPTAHLATCVHYVKCTIETLTDRLKQFKLKWSQDCRIKDTKSIVSMDVYIGDTSMNKLLGLTVAEVKEKYLRKQSEDYDRAKTECDKKLERFRGVMHLKYDFNRQMFCVFDMDNDENNLF